MTGIRQTPGSRSLTTDRLTSTIHSQRTATNLPADYATAFEGLEHFVARTSRRSSVNSLSTGAVPSLDSEDHTAPDSDEASFADHSFANQYELPGFEDAHSARSGLERSQPYAAPPHTERATFTSEELVIASVSSTSSYENIDTVEGGPHSNPPYTEDYTSVVGSDLLTDLALTAREIAERVADAEYPTTLDDDDILPLPLPLPVPAGGKLSAAMQTWLEDRADSLQYRLSSGRRL